jgi:hypothetical protein
MPAASLEDLQQQITQRELDLRTLRQELETRQIELTTLTSRKEDLQAQLRQVEAEIAALAASSPPQAAAPAVPTAAVPSTPPPPAQAQPRLADLIVTLLRHAGKAMTSRQLRDEALRRGYQTSSRNLAKTIEVRIQELKRQGMVRRATGQSGYLLVPSAEGVKAGTAKKTPKPAPAKTKKATAQVARPAKPGATAKKASRPSATVSGAAKATGPVGRGSQPPLREVLTTLFKKSNQLLSVSELAAQALAGGYRTNSANFVKVVGTTLEEMDNVDYLPGKGYRLKKTKAKT